MKNGVLNRMAQDIHEDNKRKGFYEDGEDRNIGEMLALIHSEVSEALECHRKNMMCMADPVDLTVLQTREPDEQWQGAFKKLVKDTWEDELADVFIRLLDLAAFTEVDLDTHVFLKLKYNRTRPYKHNKNY